MSAAEFELLKAKSESEGARSISDYARAALCRNDRAPYDRVEPAVHQLHDEIQELRAALAHVAELLATSRRTSVRAALTAHAGRPQGGTLQLATRKSERA